MAGAGWFDILNSLLLLAVAIMTFFNGRRTSELSIKVEQVHKATNSLQDKLIAAKDAETLAVGASKMAEGLAAGRAERKVEPLAKPSGSIYTKP